LKQRVRFSLRTLFVATTLVSLWFGYFFSRVQNEHRAANAIAAASGEIVYDWQIRPLGIDPNTKVERPGPDWLRRYLGPHWFDEIVEVRLYEFSNPSERNKFTVVGPHLAKLPALRLLSLSGGNLDLQDCVLIGQLTQIEELVLRPETVIKPQHTAAIAGARNLKEFNLSYAKTSAAAISELAAMPSLNAIDINCDSFDSQTGMPLKKYYLGDNEACAIAMLPNLRSVELFQTQITDNGVKALCELSQLETLVVSSPHVTSAVFEQVAKLQHLECLGTWAWKVNDADLQKLSQMPNLVNLDLLTSLTNESVPHLLQFDGLESLRLRGDDITEDSVRHLCELRKLTWLNLRNTGIPKNSEAATLLKQSLPACRIMLPKTGSEKKAERRFNDWKWGGMQTQTMNQK